jgi:DNA-binding Lrp family transcriptional regulator
LQAINLTHRVVSFAGKPRSNRFNEGGIPLFRRTLSYVATGNIARLPKEIRPVTDTRPLALDDIDRQLIAALQINAREPVAMLARQLGIARTTVTSRLARLEKAKIITGYGVRLSQRVVDGGLQAYVGITVQPRSGKEVLRRLSVLPQVQQLCAVSGEFDYVAWLRTDSPEQLDQLLDLIGSVDGVEKTTTSIILSSKIDRGQPV